MSDDHALPLLVTVTGVVALISPTPLRVMWLLAMATVTLLARIRPSSHFTRTRPA